MLAQGQGYARLSFMTFTLMIFMTFTLKPKCRLDNSDIDI